VRSGVNLCFLKLGSVGLEVVDASLTSEKIWKSWKVFGPTVTMTGPGRGLESFVTTWLGQDVTKKIVLRLKCKEQLKNQVRGSLRGTGVQGRKPSKIQVKIYSKVCDIL
jgi:hypothetical protein